MSESYTILPLNAEVRDWLNEECVSQVPHDGGRPLSFDELKAAVGSVIDLEVGWHGDEAMPSASLSAANGQYTSLLVDATANESGNCEFHFRGGHTELIERVVAAIAGIGGPQVIYAHSGDFTRVVRGK